MAEDGNILHWNRLEPRPRKEDFDRVLKAEVRDALWMMTRQWQFGEFQGEDAGSALFSRVQMKKTKVTKYQLGLDEASRKIDYKEEVDKKLLPLETEVEKTGITPDHLMRLEMGRYWEDLVKLKIQAILAGFAAGSVTINENLFIRTVIESFAKLTGPRDLTFKAPFEGLGAEVFYSNPELYLATELAAHGRAIDGQELFLHLDDGKSAYTYIDQTDPTISAGLSYVKLDIVVAEAEIDYLAWCRAHYAIPELPEDRGWHPGHLEHQLICALPDTPVSVGEGTVYPAYPLVADEYYQGHLDWYSFDLDRDFENTFGYTEEDYGQAMTVDSFTTIPSPIEFPGHPAPRWWEMEDGLVDWGDLKPSTADTAKLVFSDFVSNYSNDWMIFPYTLPMGTLCHMQEIVITDSFGQRLAIKPTTQKGDSDWNVWSFFGITDRTESPSTTTADIGLFFPPVIHQVQESKHMEKVDFIRDDMSNLVWAIEKVIPNSVGESMDAYEAGIKVQNKTAEFAGVSGTTTLLPNDAKVSYKIGDQLPENWIPFVPVKLEDDPFNRPIRLQRAALPRYVEGQTDSLERVRPRTTLLQENVEKKDTPDEKWKPYHIFEEEIPKSGASVMQTWQRTRTADGRVVVWLGRRKTHGGIAERGTNYKFDRLDDKTPA